MSRLPQAQDGGSDALVWSGERGILELGADEEGLGILGRYSSALEVEQLLGPYVPDGGAVVARDVVFIAEDGRGRSCSPHPRRR